MLQYYRLIRNVLWYYETIHYFKIDYDVYHKGKDKHT